ncbi:GGDEF and EAL domain-containing protein [Sporosarcina sp. YIM B06819]|uniref:putative bifunctional diguanylate cyclase/phosphodiesterase n=1 Tax=Sporosarcina sp. YIM B06819 TaxID=3081769 RepID=UPI00298BF8EB|nr:GGDEF and EAL domain-containing protein [Sporosarcina sp. YIM B06819]
MERLVEQSMEVVNAVLEELHHKQQQLLFTQEKLFVLSKDTLKPVLKQTCRDIAKLMNCDRVEIWLFNEERTELTAENIYDIGSQGDRSGDVLLRSEVPAYFDAIIHKRTLAIDDIATDPAMLGLQERLFEENDHYHSMLDASIVLSWGVGGVLCCLSEEKRHWKAIDKHVLASVADMLAFMFDRLHRLEVEEHLHALAFTDTLTGLDNQHSFNQKVTVKLQELYEGQRGIFLYMVLDQFTDIQGVLGHDGGEQVLLKMAKRLRILFPDPALIARIGFDHFVIFSPVQLSEEKAVAGITEIAEEIRKPMAISGQEVYMTFSYGVSYYPDHVDNAKAGLQAAQVALEAARKKSSRKARGVYQPTMHAFMKENLLSEMNLRKGLDLGQFRLFYQPQVTCDTGEVNGFEALIRWQHPERGLIFPGDFIDLAESTGLITIIGDWVIKEAFAQLSRWQADGKGHLTMSINLSPRHFLHAQLPSYLLECAKQSGVKPQKLMLEITENVALEDHDAVKKRIAELRALGFSIAIDDFGTGYSAFIYLQHFPIQQIKIDRQFISHLDTDANSKAIVKTIVQLGKMLGLRTIAEGVERTEEWHALKEIGCDDIQGFYFSKPLPVDEINAILEIYQDNNKLFLPIEKVRA